MNQKSNLPILLTGAVAFLSLRTKRAVAMELVLGQLQVQDTPRQVTVKSCIVMRESYGRTDREEDDWKSA